MWMVGGWGHTYIKAQWIGLILPFIKLVQLIWRRRILAVALGKIPDTKRYGLIVTVRKVVDSRPVLRIS